VIDPYGSEVKVASLETRILHISDLHFGSGFDQDLWQNLQEIAIDQKPNVLIVTGDLVNNPFWWTLKRARHRLVNLQDDIKRHTNSECQLITTPGNHDTRLWGLIPVQWIKSIWVAVALVSLLLPISGRTDWTKMQLTYWALLLLIVVALGCVRNFSRYFREFILESPTSYPDFRIAVYPFDSASKTVLAARGKLPRRQFVIAGKKLQEKRTNPAAGPGGSKNEPPVYRIAILHHHPLPIPYDASQEPLLVLDNAGAFLNEVSHLKIRLVLHGHKHHRHFSRVTINAGLDEEFEVGVLSTGTPTAGKKPGRFGYNFNFLRLDRSWNLEVTPYQASEGTFKKLKPFLIENPDISTKRLYENARDRLGFACRSGVSVIVISQDGDADRREEFHEWKIVKDDCHLEGLPYPTSVSSDPGYIELFEAGPLDENCTAGFHLDLNEEKHQLRYQEGRLRFGRGLSVGDPAINFFYQFYGVNSYAMSVQQHRPMYGEDAESPTESAVVHLKGTPFEELVQIVKFPESFKIYGNPELIIEDEQNVQHTQLQKKFRDNLKYYPKLNLVLCRIPYPPLNLTYKIQWRLTEEPPPLGQSVISLTGAADETANKLLKMVKGHGSDPLLKTLLDGIESEARRIFSLGNKDEEPMDLSIMVYDKKDRLLKVAAANFDQKDERWGLQLGYGDGIAGRAFKMNKLRLFVKALAIQNRTPYYYVRLDGKPILDSSDVEDEIVIALPLRHPEEPRAVYGILNMSSKKPSSKLLDSREEDPLLDTFSKAVCEACFQALKML
jgi:hypothetical protein